MRGTFEKLEKAKLTGNNAMTVFSQISESCASTLKEVEIEARWDGFDGELKGSFESLEKVKLTIMHGLRVFSQISESCSSTLKEVDIDARGVDFDGEIKGTFSNLRKLELRGHNAVRVLESMSQTCGPTLEELLVFERSDRGFPENIPGAFQSLRMREVDLRGKGSKAFLQSMTLPEGCNVATYGVS
eukprot:GHVU01015554.1.p1 GENE.GHVU01015554.1~~GHVU01015554.1.p1  ORF type:complete len:187 (+),score=25.67 GHVU01015554.1:104-664(+)